MVDPPRTILTPCILLLALATARASAYVAPPTMNTITSWTRALHETLRHNYYKGKPLLKPVRQRIQRDLLKNTPNKAHLSTFDLRGCLSFISSLWRLESGCFEVCPILRGGCNGVLYYWECPLFIGSTVMIEMTWTDLSASLNSPQ